MPLQPRPQPALVALPSVIEMHVRRTREHVAFIPLAPSLHTRRQHHVAVDPFRAVRAARVHASRRPVRCMCEGTATPQPQDSSDASEGLKLEKLLQPEVKELLNVLKKCSVYLIGPMGTGKSAIGKYLASELRFRFLDTDQLVEAVANKTIAEVFKDDGETAMRDLETAVLDQVAPFIGCCVATGGGVVIRKENWGRLQTGIVVYLKTPVDVLADRLQGDTTRPLLTVTDAEALRERLKDILEERKHLYEQADVVVPVKEGMPVDDVGMEVVRLLTNFIKANPPRLAALYPGDLKNKA